MSPLLLILCKSGTMNKLSPYIRWCVCVCVCGVMCVCLHIDLYAEEYDSLTVNHLLVVNVSCLLQDSRKSHSSQRDNERHTAA